MGVVAAMVAGPVHLGRPVLDVASAVDHRVVTIVPGNHKKVYQVISVQHTISLKNIWVFIN